MAGGRLQPNVIVEGIIIVHQHGLPGFDDIRPETVTPAMDVLLKQADAALERVVGPDVPPDFDAMSSVFTVATERLSRAWRAVDSVIGEPWVPNLAARCSATEPNRRRS